MAQDSAAKRRHGDGVTGKIIFRGSCGESVAGFFSGVVSGSGSAFSVMDIWGMRDDAPPSGRPQRLVGGPSSGMAQTSAAKRRHGDGGIGEIIFWRSRSETVVGFWTRWCLGVVQRFS